MASDSDAPRNTMAVSLDFPSCIIRFTRQQDITSKLYEKWKAYLHKRANDVPLRIALRSLSEAIWEFVPRKSKHYVGTYPPYPDGLPS